jgi:mannose-6-phosphate isomerase
MSDAGAPLVALTAQPVERPWGGFGLEAFGLRAPSGARVGEYWLPTTEFPLLVKLIDARENLSIQLHPDDATAGTLGLKSGKTEAWYVLGAEPGAALWLGLAEGVTADTFLGSVERGENVAQQLVRHTPAPGDFFFVPAGTVHAIGAGLTVLEIQQPADVTFRVFDWNRLPPRPLHLKEARIALRERTAIAMSRAVDRAARRLTETELVACRYFGMSEITLRPGESHPVRLESGPELYFCRSGHGWVEGAEMRLDLVPGMFLLARTPLRSLHLHAARSADAAAQLELVRMTQR